MSSENSESVNQLFPVFLKLDKLNVLIIGGGVVGIEKFTFLKKSSPNANVKIVAREMCSEFRSLIEEFPITKVEIKPYETADLDDVDLVIAATNNEAANEKIRSDTLQRRIITNVADTPELCDFYMGSIVTKGDLKIAISTNGKSPTFAKRIRQILEEMLPDELPQVLSNLRQLRKRLKVDFSEKVKELNRITSVMITNQEKEETNT